MVWNNNVILKISHLKYVSDVPFRSISPASQTDICVIAAGLGRLSNESHIFFLFLSFLFDFNKKDIFFLHLCARVRVQLMNSLRI